MNHSKQLLTPFDCKLYHRAWILLFFAVSPAPIKNFFVVFKDSVVCLRDRACIGAWWGGAGGRESQASSMPSTEPNVGFNPTT